MVTAFSAVNPFETGGYPVVLTDVHYRVAIAGSTLVVLALGCAVIVAAVRTSVILQRQGAPSARGASDRCGSVGRPGADRLPQ